MTNRQFAPVFVAVTALAGWTWRIAQDFDVPFPIRVAGGIGSVLLLAHWLRRRLDRASKPA